MVTIAGRLNRSWFGIPRWLFVIVAIVIVGGAIGVAFKTIASSAGATAQSTTAPVASVAEAPAPAAAPLAQQALAQSAPPSAYSPGQVLLPQDVRRLGIDPTRYKAEEIARYTIDIAANPQDARAYWGRAEALLNQGVVYNDKRPVLQAVEDLTRAMQLDPRNVRLYIDRGVAYSYLNDKTRAGLDFANARVLSTDAKVTNQVINSELRGMERQRAISAHSK